MISIPDAYELWQRHEAEMEEELQRLPVCDWCGEHIQDDCYYDINNEKVCECCIKDSRRWL